jgi:hypothetical protein
VILTGWKEIAAYLRCGVRTAQRWERHELPIKRPVPDRRSHVIADSERIDSWLHEGAFHRNGDQRTFGNLQRTRELLGQMSVTTGTLRLNMQNLTKRLTALGMNREQDTSNMKNGTRRSPPPRVEVPLPFDHGSPDLIAVVTALRRLPISSAVR